MNEVKINTGGHYGIRLRPWSPTSCDWRGHRLTRFLAVTGQLVNDAKGRRQWNLYCSKCKREFVANDGQLNDGRVQFCQCAP